MARVLDRSGSAAIGGEPLEALEPIEWRHTAVDAERIAGRHVARTCSHCRPGARTARHVLNAVPIDKNVARKTKRHKPVAAVVPGRTVFLGDRAPRPTSSGPALAQVGHGSCRAAAAGSSPSA